MFKCYLGYNIPINIINQFKTNFMTKFSFKKMLVKGLKYFVIFLLPFLVDKFIISYPEFAQLTIGGLLVMIMNWLKIKAGILKI